MRREAWLKLSGRASGAFLTQVQRTLKLDAEEVERQRSEGKWYLVPCPEGQASYEDEYLVGEGRGTLRTNSEDICKAWSSSSSETRERLIVDAVEEELRKNLKEIFDRDEQPTDYHKKTILIVKRYKNINLLDLSQFLNY